MILIDRLFVKAYSPNEQLVMLHLLLNADKNGVVEFSDRGMSTATKIPYQQVRTIHQKWIADGTLANAPTNASANAPTNAKSVFVTICDFDSYNAFNIFSNAVANAPTNAPTNARKKEITKEKDKVSPHTPLQIEKENNKEKEISPLYPPGEKPKGYENFDFSFVDEKFYDVFVKWLDYRRDEKKPKFIFKSQRTLEDCYKTILEVSHGIPEAADAIIRYCTSSGYQGIFVPRDFWRDWKAQGAYKNDEPKHQDNANEYSPDLPYNENMKAFVVANKFPEFNEDWPYKPDTRPDGATICNGSDGWRWDATNKRWIEMWWNRDTRQWVNR